MNQTWGKIDVTPNEERGIIQISHELPGFDPWTTAADGQYFDSRAAIHSILWIGEHIHSTDTGESIRLARWQLAILANLFGWRNADGTRRFRSLYLLIPRKNGKTELGVAIALYVSYVEFEFGGEVYFCAGRSKDQADIAFGKAVAMIKCDPVLRAFADLQRSADRVTLGDPDAGGVQIKKLSARGKSKHGYRPWVVLIDELHVVSDPELLRAMKTGSMTIREPLHLYMTTWGEETELLLSTDGYARKVISGDCYDPTFLPVIYEATAEDDWTNEETWKKSNPMYGVTIKPENFRTSFQEAKANKSTQYQFRTYHLNQRVTPPDGWLPEGIWELNATDYTLETWVRRRENWATEPLDVWIGLDLGHTRDFTAAVFCFRATSGDGQEGRIVFPMFWTTEHGLVERADKANAPFTAWAEEGWINVTSGNGVDYAQVRKDIFGVVNSFHLRVCGVAVDPQFQGLETVKNFADEGWEVIAFRQNSQTYTFPLSITENLLIQELLWHDANPVMRWMVSNTTIYTDASDCRKPRKRSDTPFGHIDGVVAMIMAISAAEQEDKTIHVTVYSQ